MNEERLLEIAKELFDNEEIELDTPKEKISEWDSLVHVMLIAAVAEEMNISVPIEEVKNISCLRDILNYAK